MHKADSYRQKKNGHTIRFVVFVWNCVVEAPQDCCGLGHIIETGLVYKLHESWWQMISACFANMNNMYMYRLIQCIVSNVWFHCLMLIYSSVSCCLFWCCLHAHTGVLCSYSWDLQCCCRFWWVDWKCRTWNWRTNFRGFARHEIAGQNSVRPTLHCYEVCSHVLHFHVLGETMKHSDRR